MFVETLGWTAGVYGACVAMPQLGRVARHRTTAGISLLAWQSTLAYSLSWVGYGVLNGFVNMWLPNLLMIVASVWMLIMVRRGQSGLGGGRDQIGVFALPVVIASLAIMLAVGAGPVAFAAGVFLPSAAAQLLHLRTLVTSPDISAVSWLFLAMGVVGQSLWLSWGILAEDASNQLVASCLILLTGLNLTWYVLRRTGMISHRIPSGRAGLVDQVLIDQQLLEVDGEEVDAVDLVGRPATDRTLLACPVAS